MGKAEEEDEEEDDEIRKETRKNVVLSSQTKMIIKICWLWLGYYKLKSCQILHAS